ncbi:MAG TPA: hypothetical protein VKA53_08025, partial [Thermoanaerobaculia bacterium]|nr:hypothetical protein [Thermoanaerobaculia bacterium]
PTGTFSQVISGNTVTNGSSDPGIYIQDSSLSSLTAANLDIHDNVVTGRTNGNGIELYHEDWPQGSQVLASCNTATTNGNGFVVDSYATSEAGTNTPDLGGGYVPSPGLNSFYSNSSYDLVANTDNISAQSNYWGTTHSIGGTYSGNVDDSNALGSAPSVVAGNELAATVSGSIITYTATLAMTGDCGCASTTFTAPTPANTTAVPGSVVVTGGTGAVVQSEDPLKVAVGALGAGGNLTVSWQVQANSGYNGSVSEQASLGCTQLASTVLSDDPSTAPKPDPTVITVGGPSVTAIPTLDAAGLALLFGLLFLAGLLLVRKRKTGVALLLAVGLMAGLALPVRAATRSAPAAKHSRSVQRARSSLHAAVLSQVVIEGRQVHLALADGTSLTVARGRVHVAPMKLDKAVKHAMSQREKRQWKRQQRKLRHLDALQSGQALVVKVRYRADGKIAHVLVRPASSLQSAEAEVTKIEKRRALRAQQRAARSGAKAASTH